MDPVRFYWKDLNRQLWRFRTNQGLGMAAVTLLGWATAAFAVATAVRWHAFRSNGMATDTSSPCAGLMLNRQVEMGASCVVFLLWTVGVAASGLASGQHPAGLYFWCSLFWYFMIQIYTTHILINSPINPAEGSDPDCPSLRKCAIIQVALFWVAFIGTPAGLILYMRFVSKHGFCLTKEEEAEEVEKERLLSEGQARTQKALDDIRAKAAQWN
eukprot:g5889.t1